jgi:hypothetical protein
MATDKILVFGELNGVLEEYVFDEGISFYV